MRLVLRLSAAVAVLAAVIAPMPASAGEGDDRDLLRSGVVGSMPDGPVLFGVVPGGVPWVDGGSTVRVRSDGRLRVHVRELVVPIAPFNGTNPVPMISASLVCNGMVAVSTAAFPFDTEGDADIRATVAVPDPCLAPAVLLNPNTVAGVYIGATG